MSDNADATTAGISRRKILIGAAWAAPAIAVASSAPAFASASAGGSISLAVSGPSFGLFVSDYVVTVTLSVGTGTVEPGSQFDLSISAGTFQNAFNGNGEWSSVDNGQTVTLNPGTTLEAGDASSFTVTIRQGWGVEGDFVAAFTEAGGGTAFSPNPSTATF